MPPVRNSKMAVATPNSATATANRALRRMRHAAMIGVEQKNREHEIGQAEREIDSEQPETAEQEQRGGNRRKTALAPHPVRLPARRAAGMRTSSRKNALRRSVIQPSAWGENTAKASAANDALAVQIAVIVDRVRIGVSSALERRDHLQARRNGRIARAGGRLRFGRRNARRDRFSGRLG